MRIVSSLPFHSLLTGCNTNLWHPNLRLLTSCIAHFYNPHSTIYFPSLSGFNPIKFFTTNNPSLRTSFPSNQISPPP